MVVLRLVCCYTSEVDRNRGDVLGACYEAQHEWTDEGMDKKKTRKGKIVVEVSM